MPEWSEEKRAQQRERSRRWRARHLDKARELGRKWYHENKEQAYATSQRWRSKNKETVLEYNRKWDAAHREERAQAAASRRAVNKEKVAEYNREYRDAHRLQFRVYKAVGRALKSGALKKGACSACGAIEVEAHHEDYSRPLDVTWLCRSHHKRGHSERLSRVGGAGRGT